MYDRLAYHFPAVVITLSIGKLDKFN